MLAMNWTKISAGIDLSGPMVVVAMDGALRGLEPESSFLLRV